MDQAHFKQEVLAMHRDQRNLPLMGLVMTHAAWISSILLVIEWPNFITYFVGFTIIGLMQYRIVMSCHEAVHKTLLFPERFNETVGLIHCSMVGMNFIRYRAQHNDHHRATKIGVDPDAYIYAPILKAKPGITRLMVWLCGTFLEIFEKFRQKSVGGQEANLRKNVARRHSMMILLAQACLCVSLTFAVGWWGYPVLWLGPLLTIAVFLNRTRVIVEHGAPFIVAEYNPESLDDVDQMTIDLLTNRLEQFLLAPFCFNYHYTHHRIQSLPHYNNAKLSAILEEQDKDRPHRIRGTYLKLLFKVLWSPLCRKEQIRVTR